jgi:hypothetical protein
MIFRILGVDQNVINEDHNKFVEFLHEDRVHDQIFVESLSGRKGYFWYVTWSDLDLMIAGTKINLREYFGSS